MTESKFSLRCLNGCACLSDAIRHRKSPHPVFPRGFGLPIEKEEVATAFREMLLNAMEHGGHFDPSQYVEICYVRTRRMILCKVKDPGEGFSIDEIKHAAVSGPRRALSDMKERESRGIRPGGFGILMTKKLVDDLIYNEKATRPCSSNTWILPLRLHNPEFLAIRK